MDFDEYQRLAARTINPKLTDGEKLAHGLYGLASEAGEVCAIFQKRLQGHRAERENLVDEMGDVLWMLAEICTVSDIDLREAAEHNIDKLKKRYPDGFNPERSVHRVI